MDYLPGILGARPIISLSWASSQPFRGTPTLGVLSPLTDTKWAGYGSPKIPGQVADCIMLGATGTSLDGGSAWPMLRRTVNSCLLPILTLKLCLPECWGAPIAPASAGRQTTTARSYGQSPARLTASGGPSDLAVDSRVQLAYSSPVALQRPRDGE